MAGGLIHPCLHHNAKPAIHLAFVGVLLVDLTPFKANIDAAIRASKLYDVSDNPRDDFYQALISDGYKPSENQIILNKLVRIGDPEDKPHKKTGWYWYF